MSRIVFFALIVVGYALVVWAFSTDGKEGMFIFFLGVSILLSTLAVGGLRRYRSKYSAEKTPKTNAFAILGALIGLSLGSALGARSGFGEVMISIFNPDLPQQDYGTVFGAVGGGILGAFLLALLSGSLLLLRRTKKVGTVERIEASSPDSRGDTA